MADSEGHSADGRADRAAVLVARQQLYYSPPSQLSEHEFVVEQLIIGVLIRGEVRDRLQTPESNVAMTTIPERGETAELQAKGELESSHNFISLQVR